MAKNQIDSKEKTKTPLKKAIVFASAILIIILGFTLYGNSLNGKFVCDDNLLVRDNIYIQNRSHIAKIFSKDIAAGAGEKCSSYRPLQMLSYMIDFSLWKLDVRGYHLSNILLHILAALSIYWLISILYDGDRALSLLTSILFLVHPIHTEAIAYISGRADPLATILMLLCFILYIKESSSKCISIYILMLLSYIFALLSRENSLVLPALLLLYHYSFKKKLQAKKFLPILSLAFIYILLRLTALRPLLPHISCSTIVLERIPGFFVALTNYTRLIFLPLNLHMEYGDKLFHLANPKAIAGILILSFLLIYAFRKRDTNRLVFFSISWFFLALLPASNLYPINAYIAEHWLYLPSIGLFLVLAKCLSFLYGRREFRIVAILSIIGLLIFYSFLTIRQNAYWREPLAFFERTLEYAPDSSRMYNDLGNVYDAINKKEEAVASYKKAIAINPDYAKSYNNLGVIYSDINKNEDAINLYKKAIAINPDYAEAYNNLGAIYKDIGKKEQAIASYKKAIAINPDYAKAYYNLGLICKDIGESEEAIPLLKKAIEINPGLVEAYNNLGFVYYAINKNEEAIAILKKAIEINPNYTAAYNNLSIIYFHKKQYKLAIEYCDRAKELGFTNLALLEALKPYREQGQLVQ